MFIIICALTALLAILIIKTEKATILKLASELKAFYRHLFSKEAVTEFRDDIIHVGKTLLKSFKQIFRALRLTVFWLSTPVVVVLLPFVLAVCVAIKAFINK